MPKTTEKYKTSPRDFFLHLLSVVALYLSAAGLLTLFFQFINHFFPDPVVDQFYRQGALRAAVRWGIALLVIVFPIYAWSLWFLEKIYKKHPSIKNIRIRKWLIYFTVFVTALIIIGDLVSLVLNFLEGELTVRFFLKVLAVFFIALGIFWYYLSIVRHEKKGKALMVFSYIVIAIVVVSVIGAFFLTGSPIQERTRRIDQQKVQVLQEVTFAVENYYREHDVIPADFETLSPTLGSYVRQQLADTRMTLEYSATGEIEYTLCTTFETASTDSENIEYQRFVSPGKTNDWEHGVGYTCFDLEIPRSVQGEVQSLTVPPRPVPSE
jgi:type II secretory pathway pseudopilin PulG